MTGQDVRVKSGVIVLLAISMAACPLALAQQISFAQPQHSQPQPFTPPPATFAAIFTATPPQSQGFETLDDTDDPLAGLDLENYILIGDRAYPIGDEFLGDTELQLAGVQQDPLGRYGVASVFDEPNLRLIWVTDEEGVRHNMIVRGDDELYSGENGFLQHFEDYQGDLLKMGGSMGIGLTGAGTIMGLGLAGCVPSVGVGCAVAIVGGIVSIVGGIAGEAYFGIFEVRPAMEALDSLFGSIDANRGSQ